MAQHDATWGRADADGGLDEETRSDLYDADAHQASQAGPFTDWPTGPIKGFDYYYGFIGDDTSQWQPNNLFRNTTPI